MELWNPYFPPNIIMVKDGLLFHASRIGVTSQMSRPALATINLAALRKNLQLIRELTPAKVIGVIKADAYGHGAIPVARVLEEERVDCLAVACIEEAITLREEGIKSPILMLEGFFNADELPLMAHHKLSTVVQQQEQIEALQHWQGEPFDIWLKIDTGMHRIGFLPEDFPHAYSQLERCTSVNRIVLMTHFSSADEPHQPKTSAQITLFKALTKGYEAETCLCNSAGIMQWPDAHGDWVRPGLALYGSSPFVEGHPLDKRLQPVMELTSQLIAIKELPAGVPVGYGETYITEKPCRVGITAVGYADGYPRHAQNGTPVLVNGIRCPIIGRISMDMLAVDISDLPTPHVGDKVTLWGQDLPATDIANYANTVSYEMFCNIKRVLFRYVDEAEEI